MLNPAKNAFRIHPFPESAQLPQTAYTDHAPAAPQTHPLAAGIEADVVIIGAGLTGLSAALHAAEEGTRVVVLEANEIAWGASGRSQGQVVPALQRELSDTEKAFGLERGHRLFEEVGKGADYVFGLIEKHKIDCRPVRHGVLAAAHSYAALASIARRAEFWRARGEELEVLDERRTADLIGSDFYVGAVLDRRGGTINALGYTRGLAAAAIRFGAKIHNGTPALALEREGAQWRVTTPGGSVRAPQVLICTNAHTGDLWPGLRQSIIPVRAFQIISKPMSENVRRTILPYGHSLADTHRVLIGLRVHADGRLHCGGSGPVMSPDAEAPYARVRKRMERTFPQLKGFEFEYAWAGWMAMTPDRFPRFHELASGLLAGFGFSGRGIVIGTLMGRELARRATGTPSDEIIFPTTKVRPLFSYQLRRPLVASLLLHYRFRDALDRRAVMRRRRSH